MIRKQVIDYRASLSLFPLQGGDTLLKKKISDTFEAVAFQISLIDLLDYFCLLWFNKNASGFLTNPYGIKPMIDFLD